MKIKKKNLKIKNLKKININEEMKNN